MKPIKSLLVLAILCAPALASAQGYYGRGAPRSSVPGGFHDRTGRLTWGFAVGLGGMSDGGSAITSCSNCNFRPLALEAARYNSSRNGVVLDVRDARGGIDGTFTITVANILANPLRMLAPVIGSRTQPGGVLALSGILEDQADAVVEAYAPWAALEPAARDGAWVLLAGRRC